MTIRDKFENAVCNLINEKPYLVGVSHLITKLPTSQIPTLCVTFNKCTFYMFYNENYVESLEFDELKAIIFHELMHVMLNHIQRYKKFHDAGINPDILNIACDAAINQYLKNLPSSCIYPSSFGAPEGFTFEQYVDFIINKFYNNVKQITQKSKMKGGGGSGNGSPNDEQGDNDQDGQDDDQGQAEGQGSGQNGGQKKPQNGKLTEGTKDNLLKDLFDQNKCGSHDLWKDIDADEAETAKDLMRAAVLNAAGKMAGDMPGDLIQKIEAAWEEVINWKAAIRYFYQSVIASYKEFSRTVRDRRRGLEVPGSKKGYSCRLLFCTDNSGSMSDKDLAHVISECRYLGKVLKIEADVLQFDYVIQDICDIEKFVAEKKFKGRGGTNFQEPFNFMQDKKFRRETLTKLKKKTNFKKYDGIIIYTDGQAGKPEIYKKMRILWLMTPGNHKPGDWPGRETEVKIKE